MHLRFQRAALRATRHSAHPEPRLVQRRADAGIRDHASISRHRQPHSDRRVREPLTIRELHAEARYRLVGLLRTEPAPGCHADCCQCNYCKYSNRPIDMCTLHGGICAQYSRRSARTAERRCKFRCRCKAIRWQLRQCSEHSIFHIRRHGVAQRARRRGSFGHHLGNYRLHARPCKWWIAAQHFICHRAQRIDVGARIDVLLAHRLLWRHVLRCAE